MDITKWVEEVQYGGAYVSELELLNELAEGKDVLEIGAMVGMSTVCIAEKANSISSIDIWSDHNYDEIIDDDSRGHYREVDKEASFYKQFLTNTKDINHKLIVYHGDSKTILPTLANNNKKEYDMIFIDGDHSYGGTLIDYINSTDLLVRDGGILAFHDHGNPGWPGVEEVCDFIDKYDNRLEYVEQVETLRVYRRVV